MVFLYRSFSEKITSDRIKCFFSQDPKSSFSDRKRTHQKAKKGGSECTEAAL